MSIARTTRLVAPTVLITALAGFLHASQPARAAGEQQDNHRVVAVARATASSTPQDVANNPIWSRAYVTPLPATTAGVQHPEVSLNGTWKINATPPADFWSNDVDPGNWTNMPVPGQPTMHGLQVTQDQEFAYKRRLQIPADAAGSRVLLQFDGVYSKARIWVDGRFVREHTGGFTSWDADITDYVTPGKASWLTVGVTDLSTDISTGSSYAHTLMGGIVRDVRMLTVPATRLTRLDTDTTIDDQTGNASLRVFAGASLTGDKTATVNLSLTDPFGHNVKLTPNQLPLTGGHAERYIDIPVSKPRLWDPEHPWLYTLTATEVVDGRNVETTARTFGFRSVRVDGNKLLVNGEVVKLRGANHHQISPVEGRATSAALDAEDIKLFRDANVNFLRTSHYPPTRELLEAADKYGMFIEEETAVCFQGFLAASTQGDPDYSDEYLNQFSEMLARDRSHPSVLMWSLGNESAASDGTLNFELENDYAHAEDTRPTISGPSRDFFGPFPDADIWSDHYPAYGDNIHEGVNKPMIYDEYGAVPARTFTEELIDDPNVNNDFGTHMAALWDKLFTKDGVTGGAIWGGVDDVFLEPGGVQGYGEWGILDVWRRPKPEYAGTKRAYSPIRIDDLPVQPGSDGTVRIPVKNRFDFANFSELTITWRVGDRSGRITSSVAPHQDGVLTLRIPQLSADDVIDLRFERRADPRTAATDLLVDEYRLPVLAGVRTAGVDSSVRDNDSPTPAIEQTTDQIVVSGGGFSVPFDKSTGLIHGASYHGTTVIESGPVLRLGSDLTGWALDDLQATSSGKVALVTIRGHYGDTHVTFAVSINGAGLISTAYTIDSTQASEYTDVGVSFDLPAAVYRFDWQRNADSTAYSSDHIGRAVGQASKVGPDQPYGTTPTWPWSRDTKQFGVFGKDDPGGRGTVDFRSRKEHIVYGSAVLPNGARLRAESPGLHAVKLAVTGNGVRMTDSTFFGGYPVANYSLQWLVRDFTTNVYNGYSDTARVRLTGRDGAPADVVAAAAAARLPGPVDVKVLPGQLLAGRATSVQVLLRGTGPLHANVSLAVPSGWSVTPGPIDSSLTSDMTWRRTTFQVTPPADATGQTGTLTATAAIGSTTLTASANLPVEAPGRLVSLRSVNDPVKLVEGMALPVTVEATAASAGTAHLRLDVPDGWKVDPATAALDFESWSLTQQSAFNVTPPDGVTGPATLHLVGEGGGVTKSIDIPVVVNPPGQLTDLTVLNGADALVAGIGTPLTVLATVSSPTTAHLHLDVPDGWAVDPATSDVTFGDSNLTQAVSFTVTPPAGSVGSATLHLTGESNGVEKGIEVPVTVSPLGPINTLTLTGGLLLQGGVETPVTVNATAASPTMGTVTVTPPPGWSVAPASRDLTFPSTSALTQQAKFTLTPPAGFVGGATVTLTATTPTKTTTVEVPVTVNAHVLNDDDPAIVYAPPEVEAGVGWFPQNESWTQGAFHDDWHDASNSSRSASLTFTGTSVSWITNTQNNFGKADVYLDGQLVADDLDFYTPETIWQIAGYTATGLSQGEHTIKIVPTGTQNPASGGPWIAVDGFTYS